MVYPWRRTQMEINSPGEPEEGIAISIYFNNAEIKVVLHKTENDYYVDMSYLNYWKESDLFESSWNLSL